MSEKCLLDQWRDMAYDRNLPKDQLEKFWGTYFQSKERFTSSCLRTRMKK